jgi:hypothetical protein
MLFWLLHVSAGVPKLIGFLDDGGDAHGGAGNFLCLRNTVLLFFPESSDVCTPDSTTKQVKFLTSGSDFNLRCVCKYKFIFLDGTS